KPAGYDATRRYPLIVLMEGSHGVFDLSYSSRVSSDGFSWFGFQPRVLAALGYVVLMPNPRGSWGFGEAFERKEVGDFGNGPYQDIVSGVDALIASGVADSARLGIMGSGFDGYRAALALTRTNGFRV